MLNVSVVGSVPCVTMKLYTRSPVELGAGHTPLDGKSGTKSVPDAWDPVRCELSTGLAMVIDPAELVAPAGTAASPRTAAPEISIPAPAILVHRTRRESLGRSGVRAFIRATSFGTQRSSTRSIPVDVGVLDPARVLERRLRLRR